MPPPGAPRAAPSAPRGVTTGSVPRRITSIAPAGRKTDPAKPSNGKAGLNKDAGKDAAPVPRPRPAVANAKPEAPNKPDAPKTSTDDGVAAKPSTPDSNSTDKNADKPDNAKPDAKEAANAKAANPEPAKTEPTKAEEPKSDVRVIDMSKPKTPEKPEDKPGEAIRF